MSTLGHAPAALLCEGRPRMSARTIRVSSRALTAVTRIVREGA